jgi:hypothetical protein
MGELFELASRFRVIASVVRTAGIIRPVVKLLWMNGPRTRPATGTTDFLVRN